MPPVSPPLTPPAVFGRYELRSVLGRGGAGVVYDATLLGMGGFKKRVALKVLATDEADGDGWSSLQREARVGALLSHPHVVSILDLGREQGRWYIAMELVDGHPVSAMLRAGVIDAAAVVEIGLATCAGLTHVHELRVDGHVAGLVHRDVKPQNLLVDRNGTLKLADFGVTALASTDGGLAGTPTWMAPEQQAGQVSPAADLFSLGAVLYALAARRAPFGTGDTALRQSRRVEALLADPAFLAPVEAAVPGLARIVHRCLRLDPHDRYPSAAALGAELRALRALVGWSDLGALVSRVGAEPGPRAATPTPRSVSTAPRRSALVGRREEVTAVCRAFASGAREVVVTGPGGVGKTRVAQEAVEQVGRAERRRPVWVELGGAGPDDGLLGLARSTARALGLDLTQADPLAQVAAALAARPDTLLVIDGADAAGEAVGALSARLAATAPEVRLLVTTRLPARAPDQVVVALPPLSPADAAALFEQRVPAPLRGADREALPDLVAELDGLPLAIELAAARTRTLGVPAILERMRDRFRLLVDPSRPGTSLRSTIAASFALLRPWEAHALGQLSVFVDGFSLEAAEAVLDLGRWPEAPWPLDVLSGLLDASLLLLDRSTGRFALLRAVREYASESLDPEARAAAELRHGEWSSALGADDIEHTTARRRPELLRAIERELANLRAACERAVARGDVRVAEQTAYAATSVYLDRGPFQVGSDLLDRVLALPGLKRRPRLTIVRWSLKRALGRQQDVVGSLAAAEAEALAAGQRGTALSARALATLEVADGPTAAAALRSVIDEARAWGESGAEGRACSMLGNRLLELGDGAGSRAALNRALEVFTGLGDVRGTALATLRLGRVDQREGATGAALRAFEAAERLFRESGDDTNAWTAAENRAAVLADDGELPAATAIFEEVHRFARRTGARHTEVNVTANLGEAALRAGRVDEARARYEQALVVARTGGWRALDARITGLLGDLEHHLGRRAEANARWASAARGWRAVGHQADAADVEARRWLADVESRATDPASADAVLGAVHPYQATWAWLQLGHALLDQGDLDGATHAAARLGALCDARPPHRVLRASRAVLEARRAVLAGDEPPEGGLSEAGDVLREEWLRARWHQARVELAWARGARDEARRALAGLVESVDRAGFGPGTGPRAAASALGARLAAG